MTLHFGRSRWCGGLLSLLIATLPTCDESSGSGEPPESNKVRITDPTFEDKFTVSSPTIDLGGWAGIDGWSWNYDVEPHVRWVNATTGEAHPASEWVEWDYLFGYYPVDHTWTATVPLVPGYNYIRVEAYYSGSDTIVGVDAIRVLWR